MDPLNLPSAKPSIHLKIFGNFVIETRTVVGRRGKVSETFEHTSEKLNKQRFPKQSFRNILGVC